MEKKEREGNGSKVRKTVTIYSGLHPISNVEWFYLPGSEGDRGFISIDNCINDEREN